MLEIGGKPSLLCGAGFLFLAKILFRRIKKAGQENVILPLYYHPLRNHSICILNALIRFRSAFFLFRTKFEFESFMNFLKNILYAFKIITFN